MQRGQTPGTSARILRHLATSICALLVLAGNVDLWAMQGQSPQQPQQQQQQGGGSADQNAKLSNDQLDSLVAPIALYPDPLLTQTLVASTYPLEIVQLGQWLEQNKGLKDKALKDAVSKQNWDPSIQAMAPFPDIVKQMAQNIKWTNDLGNAFLAQQDDVMDAVQRMRSKAVEKGALKTTEQQKVETKTVENKSVVVIQPSQPDVVYVPTYNPTVVWGTPYYPYPPVAYPAYPTGGLLLGFTAGVAMGAAWGGGWGWNTGWGHNNVYVNRNNTFVSNYNRTNAGRYGAANGNWQHNAQHRGGAPYANQNVANRYGGTARGNNLSQRQTAARQGQARGQGQLGGGQAGGSQFRSGGGGANAQNFNRGAGGGAGGGGGGDRIGNRQTSSGSMGSRNSSAFSGGSGSTARASSARGASSMGGGGGGFRGGGGGRGGGGRRR